MTREPISDEERDAWRAAASETENFVLAEAVPRLLAALAERDAGMWRSIADNLARALARRVPWSPTLVRYDHAVEEARRLLAVLDAEGTDGGR